jgi:hypothetical protein
MDPDDVAHLAAPAQNSAADVIEIRQVDPAGDRNHTDHHRADMAKHARRIRRLKEICSIIESDYASKPTRPPTSWRSPVSV